VVSDEIQQNRVGGGVRGWRKGVGPGVVKGLMYAARVPFSLSNVRDYKQHKLVKLLLYTVSASVSRKSRREKSR